MKSERMLFEAWFNIDETTNGCRGTSALERDQMFAAWQAGRASILKELAEQEPVAWMFPADLDKFAESETFAQAYSVKVGSPDGVTAPLIPQPILEE